jgi:hypothetical protein
MRAYQCDRCGKFYSRSNKDLNKIFITGSCTSNMYIKDLCDKCQRELEVWWEKKKKAKMEADK